MSDGPLDGIRVLDLSSVGPASRASRWLSDYGASVVKVGPVPRAAGVQITPPFHAYGGGRGMKRVLVDLKAPEGREVLLRLADRADVVLESFRPGVVGRLGIGFAEVSARNPGVVYCSTSGYGQEGPRSAWAGHDLDYLAVAGFLHAAGRGPQGEPVLPGATVADSAGGGLHAVVAILAALVARASTGRGAYLDVAVADGVLALMALQLDEYLATGEEPAPGTSLLTGRYACYATYRTSDDRWLAVAAIEPRFWANFCAALGLQRWAGHQTDDAVQEAIRADVAAAVARHTQEEWSALLPAADTCVAPVLSVAQVTEDPALLERGLFVDAEHPSRGRVRQLAPVLAGCPRPAQPLPLPDPARTDTDEVLSAHGISAPERVRLRDLQVVA